MMNMLKMCVHPRVIAGLAAVALGIGLLAPQWFAAALPLLFLAICPLSMVVMMKMIMPGTASPGAAADASAADSEASLEERLRQLEAEQAVVAQQLQTRRQPQR